MMPKILFVDDDATVLSGLRRVLRTQSGWKMTFVTSAHDALVELDSGPIDVIVSDYSMRGMDGAALLEAVRARSPETVQIMMTGHLLQCRQRGGAKVADHVLSKPCDPHTLVTTIQRSLQNRMRSGAV